MSRRKLTKPLQDSVVFVAWENIDAQRWILADDYGRLYFFMLMLENSNVVSSWKIDMIGHTSRASVLVYLDGGYVFVGSHQGDSQVIKINERSIEVVQKLSNIAPILDLNIMDLGSRRGNSQINEYSSGQARIVTGSGAFQDGSLRSVRSGVGIEEHGLLGEMDHITELFSLRSTSSNKHVDLLVLSFIDETRVFYFNRDGEVEEKAEYQNLLLSEPTLLAANLRNNHILQITRSSVRVVDMENGIMVSQWSPSDGETITAASANLENLIISVGGIIIMVLELEKDLYVLTKKKFGNDQIACIHIPTFSSEFCIAGFWHSASIAILKLESLEIIQEIIISDEVVSVPRSILVSYLLAGQPPTLLVAMANGEVVTFSVSLDDFSLSAKKVVVLGTQQASLKLLPRSDGLANIFAICEQPSLIYSSDGRIVYSAVTAEKASCVCPFDSEAYPKAIAIATAEDLKIASVDTERTTHVQTLHMKESVRRVAYSTNLKAFGLGTIKRTLQDGNEIVQSSFKLVDEILFTALDSFAMEEEELVESVIRADLREHEDADTVVERFVVGTSFSEEKPKARVNGRILVFAVTPTRSLQLITELELRGSCRTLGVVDGNIVAGLVSTASLPIITFSAFAY